MATVGMKGLKQYNSVIV